jgi:hypothetical protein
MSRWLVTLLLTCACGGEGGGSADAGMDAIRRLALTVDGTPALQPITRSVKVTITANGSTRNDTFPIAGLPATVDVPQPIQLSTWSVVVDGYDGNGQLVGRGMTTLASGTAEASMSIAPI